MCTSGPVCLILVFAAEKPEMSRRYGSIYMGRPTMIKDSDSDTPFPYVDPVRIFAPRSGIYSPYLIVQDEDAALWQPLPTDGIPYTPTPGRIMSSFSVVSRLCEYRC